MTSDITKALDNFVSQYLQLHREEDTPLTVQYDSEWVSPCHQMNADEGEWVTWQPVKQVQAQDFKGFEEALEIELNPDLKAYFSHLWSDNLNATTEKGGLQLLLPWNHDDFLRLQQNLVGHILMKRRLGQAETVFFAVTDEEDFIISVENKSGKVVLEQVGMVPKETLSDSLAEFLRELQPSLA